MLDQPNENAAQMRGTLRDALRETTAEPHRALDALLSTLNLLKPERRAAFCRIQLLGFATLRAACDGHAAEATDVLQRQIEALEAETGLRAPDIAPASMRFHPDAVAYVTLGAQLGTAMMRRALPEQDQTGYFGLEPDMHAWRAFCDRMRAIPRDTPQAAAILWDAYAVFTVFIAAADEVMTEAFPATHAAPTRLAS